MKDIIKNARIYSKKSKSKPTNMKKLFNTNVFTRNNHSTISERTFLGSIAAFICYGLLLTYIMATQFAPQNPGTLFMIGVGLILPIIGSFISRSNNLPISFLGYNLIVLPIGLCLGPLAAFGDSNVISDAALLTAAITGLMGFAGITYPDLFKNLGGVLFYSLLSLIVVRLLAYFIPALNFGFIDYIAAGIFSLYIGYDMYRSTTVGRTTGNALHIAVSLYLDILNLFLTLVSIFSSDND
jgi:FtsH-binding integral membrane protein